MGKTMKRIPLEPLPQTIFGRPFRIADMEKEPSPEVYQCKSCGAEIEVVKPVMVEEATLSVLLKMLIFNIPKQACTMEDSINAFSFIQQADKSLEGDSKVLEVSEGILKWLKETCKKYGVAVYGVNTDAIMRAMDGFERAHEAKEEE